MKRGKAQFSIEFLVTYGWALLILVVIVGAIYTFGWIDPANFLPQKCTFYGQIGCKDYYVTPDVFNLSLVNNFGVQLYVDGIQLIIDGEAVCNSTGQKLQWNRSKTVLIGLNLASSSCSQNVIENAIIPGRRAQVQTQITFFSNQTCPACWTGDLGCEDCSHTSMGEIYSKVSE